MTENLCLDIALCNEGGSEEAIRKYKIFAGSHVPWLVTCDPSLCAGIQSNKKIDSANQAPLFLQTVYGKCSFTALNEPQGHTQKNMPKCTKPTRAIFNNVLNWTDWAEWMLRRNVVTKKILATFIRRLPKYSAWKMKKLMKRKQIYASLACLRCIQNRSILVDENIF